MMLYQVDKSLSGCEFPQKPAAGWLSTVRQALGMTAVAAGARADISGTAWADAESREAAGTISLKALADMADALGCDVGYALIPRGPLMGLVEERAREIAQSETERMRKTMALEGQEPAADFLKMKSKSRERELIGSDNWAQLWRQ